jgi:hypothetical protein
MTGRSPVMRRRRLCALAATAAALACLCAVLSLPVLANDSSAYLATGGLVMARNDAIEMRSEDLFVSTAEIRVTYHFLNRSNEDVTTLVAFPLPEIRSPSEEDNFVIPVPEADRNFLAFETKVDGHPVVMQVEQRAETLGVDRTAWLESLGLPLAPHDPALPDLLARLPEDTRRELYESGMTDDPGIGPALPYSAGIQPRWTARTTFYWKQTFPAGREIVIEHRYQPSVGGSAQTSIGEPFEGLQERRAYAERFCIEDSFVRAVNRARARAGSDSFIFSEARLEYVLVTGANWAGPIGRFTLTVDKGAPENLTSFCMDGVQKIAPTQFRVEKTDFWPDRNLQILILEPHWLQ